jgi:hypothetical protein
MKRVIRYGIGALTFSLLVGITAAAERLVPGQVDFGAFSPPKGGGEFVEVNIPPGLISLGAKLVEKDEPDVAQVLTGLKMVRVNVIGLDDENRGEIQSRVQRVRKDLSGKGWERVVTAQQKDQDVGVYLKMTDKGAVQGLAAVVMDGKEHAVFVNIVGDIKPEQIAMIGEKLHVDPLKHLGNTDEKPTLKTGE